MVGDVLAQRLVSDAEVHWYTKAKWLEMFIYIGWKCGGSLVGDVAANWLKNDEDVVAHGWILWQNRLNM